MEDFAEIASPEGQASHDRAAEGLARRENGGA
jgi:hypothetical protein